ncbi:MAG: ABC transporter ATP-binding protein [Thomasclavelia sp.]|uniref:ABC transporter ATP-binding protein n=1 Tax=Thomasclavelia sp. TaxID=3025757 RepID=UPI00399F2A8A
MNIIEISHLKKSFGNHHVITDLNLTIPQNCIYGFLGKNGQGKTTTMKMILGLLKIDEGSISVCNQPVTFGQNKTNQYIGYLPDVPSFYNHLNAFEYLKLCGEITGLDKKEISTRSQNLLTLVDLQDNYQRIGTYSRGMKQRLGIVQALLNKPKVLICDEPTSALDPKGRKEILDILIKVKKETTVLFSTHILSDIERICDYVAIINNGKVVINGQMDELKRNYGKTKLMIQWANQTDLQNALPYFTNYTLDHLKMIFNSNDLKQLQLDTLTTLTQHHLLPQIIEITEPSIEDLFLEAVL